MHPSSCAILRLHEAQKVVVTQERAAAEMERRMEPADGSKEQILHPDLWLPCLLTCGMVMLIQGECPPGNN